MDFDDILKELEMDGEGSEAVSFQTIIDLIDAKEEDAKELFEDMPALAKLMRSIHKQGFWRGAEFGRMMFMKTMENEEKFRIVEEYEREINDRKYPA